MKFTIFRGDYTHNRVRYIAISEINGMTSKPFGLTSRECFKHVPISVNHTYESNEYDDLLYVEKVGKFIIRGKLSNLQTSFEIFNMGF